MKPRKLSLVKFDEGEGYPTPPMPKELRKQYPFGRDEHLMFIGEIVNMPGHCVLVRKNGEVVWGYHTDNFKELTDEET